jgi:hypothetical protein
MVAAPSRELRNEKRCWDDLLRSYDDIPRRIELNFGLRLIPEPPFLYSHTTQVDFDEEVLRLVCSK